LITQKTIHMKRFVLMTCLLVGATAFAQNVTNKLSFQPGQKLEVVTANKQTTSLQLMGQQMDNTVNSTLTESYDIQKADAQGATIEYKVKRLVLSISGGMGGDQSFDSEKEGDRKGELGKLLEKGLKNKYTMTIDAFGNVTSVKADDDNPNAKGNKEEDAMMEMIASQLGFRFGLPKVGDATIFKLLPKEITKSDTWTDTSSANGENKKIVYKVNTLDDNNLVLDYNEESNTDATQEMMGQTAKVKSTSKGSGKITIDRKTGILRQKTFSNETSGTIEAQQMSIPSTGKSETNITISVK
jgi:hypothetical protein